MLIMDPLTPRFLDLYDNEEGKRVKNNTLKQVDFKEHDVIMLEQNKDVIRRDKTGKKIGEKKTIWAALAYLGLEVIQVYKKEKGNKDTPLGVYIRSEKGVFLDYSDVNNLGIRAILKPSGG